MIVKIQHRRGSYNDYDPSKLLPGEIAVTQSNDPNSPDGRAIYIATAAGNVKRLASADELKSDIETALQDAIPKFVDEATQKAQDAADRAEAAAEHLLIDTTLTQTGQAADAKVTGDEITGLKNDLRRKTGLSEEIKVALLDCFEHVAWVDEHGQDYYDALYNALHTDTALVRITATFAQGSLKVYEDTPLNSLKAYLTVTGYYDDGETEILRDYSLSGELKVGTSTITVSKDGKTATFEVTVTQGQETGLLYRLPSVTELNGVNEYVDTGIQLMKTKRNFTIVVDFNEDNGVLALDKMATLFHCMLEDNVNYIYPGISCHFAYSDNGNTKFFQSSYNGNTSNSNNSIYHGFSNVSIGRVRYACSVDTDTNIMTVCMKVNGELAINQSISEIKFASIDETLLIGAYRTSDDVKGRFFKGTINEFKVYNHAFSNDECVAYVTEV